MKELLMGNEAIAVGALAAGVQVVSGYPGTPSSEVLQTIAKRNPGGVYVEWSVNEKAGAEVAAGAAYSGARSMVTMKQMGLNVASDPVMCVNYIGVKGGMVIYVADDPGPISSQTEQDTRHFGKYARIPVFDCDSPSQAFQAVQDAFDFSEEHHTPVILRSTTRVCHACEDIEVPDLIPPAPAEGFHKDSKWVIFPGLAYRNKLKLVSREHDFAELFSDYPGNALEEGGRIGIACGGISYAYVREALAGCEDRFTILKIGTPYPFPSRLARRFLEQVDTVLCFEELDPFIEDALIYECGKAAMASAPSILGKRTGTVPAAGELSAEIIASVITDETGISTALSFAPPEAGAPGGSTEHGSASQIPVTPVRPPVLCAGCPHRGAFYAVKQAAKQAVYHGDIGCYTLGNAAPLNMVDTCLCMGAGITMAQGMYHSDPKTLNFAFVGDSTFFASGVTGTINAVYNQAEIILCILDNSTTAMTGHQPHPGMGITMMGERVEPIHIEKVLEGIGVPWIRIVDPLDHSAALAAVREAIDARGVRAIVFRSPCISLKKKTAECHVDPARCVGCMRCIREIGCPAMAPAAGGASGAGAGGASDAGPGGASSAGAGGASGPNFGEACGLKHASEARRKVVIDPALCAGCSLCAQLCPTGCIETISRSEKGKEARS